MKIRTTMKSAKVAGESRKKSAAFSEEEHAAMREHVREQRADKNDESAVLPKIAEMREPDRTMGKRLHAIIRASAPALSPRLWYGMPAYAKDNIRL